MSLIAPMEPILREKIINDREWIHQIKWDGIRGITYLDNSQIRLFTKSGRERTDYYPELNMMKDLVNQNRIIFDGEIIVLNDIGKPTFQSILARERITSTKNIQYYTKKYPIKYIVFDILAVNDRDLTKCPLKERKEILLDTLKQNHTIGIADDFIDGYTLFNFIRERGWEGIVSKRLNSLYFPGKKHDDWYKIKINKKILTVIGGIHWKGDFPNSLLLGIYKDEKLIYVGRASSGLKRSDLFLLKDNLNKISGNTNPFVNPTTDTNSKNVTWLKPLLTCWVQFLEWTTDGHLRHPQIIGFSSDKPIEATGREIVL